MYSMVLMFVFSWIACLSPHPKRSNKSSFFPKNAHVGSSARASYGRVPARHKCSSRSSRVAGSGVEPVVGALSEGDGAEKSRNIWNLIMQKRGYSG